MCVCWRLIMSWRQRWRRPDVLIACRVIFITIWQTWWACASYIQHTSWLIQPNLIQIFIITHLGCPIRASFVCSCYMYVCLMLLDFFVCLYLYLWVSWVGSLSSWTDWDAIRWPLDSLLRLVFQSRKMLYLSGQRCIYGNAAIFVSPL